MCEAGEYRDALDNASDGPQRSPIEQIIDSTIERLRATGDFSQEALSVLSEVMMRDRLPGHEEVIIAANEEDAPDGTP